MNNNGSNIKTTLSIFFKQRLLLATVKCTLVNSEQETDNRPYPSPTKEIKLLMLHKEITDIHSQDSYAPLHHKLPLKANTRPVFFPENYCGKSHHNKHMFLYQPVT